MIGASFLSGESNADRGAGRASRRVRAKALQNLRAANLLFERGHFDAAASRYHYAAFQARVFALERRGTRPSGALRGTRRWGHAFVRSRATSIRGRSADESLLPTLPSLREDADGNPAFVGRWRVEDCRREAERFIEDGIA